MPRTLLSILIGLFLLFIAGGIIMFFHPPLALGISLLASAVALSFLFLLFQQRGAQPSYLKKNSGTLFDLQDLENRFKTVFEFTTTGIALLDMDGHLIKCNQSFCDLFGYSEAEISAINFYHLVFVNEINTLPERIHELIDHKKKSYQVQQQCLQKNGEKIWVLATLSIIRNERDEPCYFIVQVQNITPQKNAEESLRHMAYHDPLTRLGNRNKLMQFIQQSVGSSRRHAQAFALLFLDLDRFKNINDTLGHDAGDSLLRIIADRLHNAVRTTDLVVRLGGDEFVLVITDVKKAESVALIAQKILKNVLEVITIDGQEIYTTTSIGIAVYPYDGQDMDNLMKNADLALYRAKDHGRNNYQFYTGEMTSRAHERLALQNALGHALAKEEFMLHYQPKLEIKTQRITGVEALLRWKNKTYSKVTPEEIITLAEETGLIIPVSKWIIKTACEQLKAWHEQGFTSLTMAINCSARQSKQISFGDDLITMIKQANVHPSFLEVEITESGIMQDPENVLRVLDELKECGVQIAVDNFGTGYWSLSNLRKLSVDKIKIDKTFIKQVSLDDTSAMITSAIIAMVNKLGIKSVAEGVETKEQYEFLAKEGCTEVQGYYLTVPLSAEAMTLFLREHRSSKDKKKQEIIS